MSAKQPPSREVSRRHALTGAAAVGLGLPLLAACGDDTDSTAGDPAAAPSGAAPSTDAASPGGGGRAEGLVPATEVEVGGGVVLADQEVVVTQPTEGEFKAFSSICTHQGCPVAEVSDGVIVCPCHNSTFSIDDGSPQGGPAATALPEVAVRLQGDQVVRA